jgi:Zn-finger nucleic acid-binding protein
MRCPTDGAELVMAERQGVEIDYCPSCRGVWLDRGELDKILDRAAGMAPGGAASAPVAPVSPPVPPPPAPERGFERYPTSPAPAAAPGYGGYREDDRYREGYRDDRRYDQRGAVRDPRDPRYPYGRKKKRESWLGDLLDFD